MNDSVFICVNDSLKINDTIIKKNEIGIVVEELPNKLVVNLVNLDFPVSIPKEKTFIFNPKETGDAYTKKICNLCNRLLPVENFAKNQNGINNRTVRRPSCNECREVIDGKNIPSKLKKEWEKKKPNYVIWQCPICKKKTIPGITSKVVLDHNHYSGAPRAWICDSCNTGLGRFKDSIATLQSAIDYLKKVD